MLRLLAAGLVFLAMTSAAGAATFPGERPVDDGLAMALTGPADQFWQHLGWATTPATVYFADLSGPAGGGAPMAGQQSGNKVWIDTAWWAGVRGLLAAKRTPLAYRRDALTVACTAMAHERGHNLGLGHVDDGGIMDWDGPTSDPGICVGWAISLLPRRHLARRVSSRRPSRT